VEADRLHLGRSGVDTVHFTLPLTADYPQAVELVELYALFMFKLIHLAIIQLQSQQIFYTILLKELQMVALNLSFPLMLKICLFLVIKSKK